MAPFYKILLLLLVVLGWLAIPFGLPGTLLIFGAAALYALPMDYLAVSDWQVLGILFALTLLAELMETGVVYLASRRAQVPMTTTILAIIGGMVGAVIGVPVPVLGSVIGLFLGIALTGFFISLIQTRELNKSWQLTKAILISRTLATATKMILATIMAIYLFTQV